MRTFIVIIISFTSRTIVIMLECGLCRFLAIFCIIELYMCLSVHNSLSCTYGFFSFLRGHKSEPLRPQKLDFFIFCSYCSRTVCSNFLELVFAVQKT